MKKLIITAALMSVFTLANANLAGLALTVNKFAKAKAMAKSLQPQANQYHILIMLKTWVVKTFQYVN